MNYIKITIWINLMDKYTNIKVRGKKNVEPIV
jgi:hypothetical protein